MKRIVYGIVLLMFLAGTLFAVGCGPKKEDKVDLKNPPAAPAPDDGK